MYLARREAVNSWEIGAFKGEYPVRVPLAPIWTILTLGAGLTALQYLFDAIRYSQPDATLAEDDPVAGGKPDAEVG